MSASNRGHCGFPLSFADIECLGKRNNGLCVLPEYDSSSTTTYSPAMNLDYSRHYLTACDPTTYPPCRLDSASGLGLASKTWSTRDGSRLSGNRMAPPEGFMPPYLAISRIYERHDPTPAAAKADDRIHLRTNQNPQKTGR